MEQQQNKQPITVEEIDEGDNSYFEELEKSRHSITKPIKTLKITEDLTISVTDDNIKNLFCDNKMKLRKRINISIPPEAETSITSSYTTRFPRKAKLKPPSSICIDDDDDDFLNDDFPSVLHPSTRLKTLNKTNELDISTSKNVRKNQLENKSDTSDTPSKKAKSTLDNFFNAGLSRLSNYVIPKVSRKEKKDENHLSKETKKVTVECPMCQVMFSQSEIEAHAFECQGPKTTRQRKPEMRESEAFNQSLWNTEVKAMKGSIESTNGHAENNKVNNNISDAEEAKAKTFYTSNSTNKTGLKDYQRHKLSGTAVRKPIPVKPDTSNKKGVDEIDYTFLTDDEENVDDILKQYATKNNNPPRKTVPRAFGCNNFNDSDNSDPYSSGDKCYRCSKAFAAHDEAYLEHIKTCLNESKQDNTLLI